MLDVACNHFQFIVPHDREPGSTERLVEMYIKAVKTAFAGSVKHITAFRSKRKNETNTQAKSKKAPSRAGIFPMQVNLSGSDITFKFEHHPMEAWFAVHGPLLRKMAVQVRFWYFSFSRILSMKIFFSKKFICFSCKYRDMLGH